MAVMMLVSFDYINWRGEHSRRTVRPLRIRIGTSEYHDGRNVYLEAIDTEKKKSRDFLMKNISNWSEEERDYEI